MKKSIVVVLLVLVAIASGAFVAWQQYQQQKGMPEGLILANGRLEGDRYTLAPKYAGRVAELLAREGDQVKAGQVVARLEDQRLQAKLAQAQGQAAAARAALAAAEAALDLLQKQVPLQIDTARADVAHAQAALKAAEARVRQRRIDARRYRKLTGSGAVDKFTADQAQLALEVAQADLITARSALEQARKRLAEAELGKERIDAKTREVEAARARAEAAEAAVAEIQSMLDDMAVKAPVSGTLVTRIVDPGEVVAAGAPLLTLVDLDRLYLKVYVPEHQIGKLRLGLEARIYTDAFPDQPFEAHVRYIASQAQFTPKEVQTPDERVKLVYAVKLYLDENPDHRLTPGIPADAVIRWQDDVPWTAPRW